MHRADPAYHTTPFAQTRWDALATMVRATPATVPRQRRTWPLWASLAAHGVLVLALVFSVAWKSSPPAALQAELWDALPTPSPSPNPNTDAPAASDQAAPVQPPPVAAPPPEPEAIAPALVKPPKVALKPDATLLVKPDAKRNAQPALNPVLTPEKAPSKPSKAEQTKEAERAKETARLAALLDTHSGPPKTGAPQASGLNASWGAKLQACVQPHMRFADASGSNPRVELTVQLLPSGTPVGVRVVKPSSTPAFDAAVERAIMRCDPFPRPDSGALPSSLSFGYSLRLGQ